MDETVAKIDASVSDRFMNALRQRAAAQAKHDVARSEIAHAGDANVHRRAGDPPFRHCATLFRSVEVALDHPRIALPSLLHRMGQFVRQQSSAVAAGGREFPLAKDD